MKIRYLLISRTAAGIIAAAFPAIAHAKTGFQTGAELYEQCVSNDRSAYSRCDGYITGFLFHQLKVGPSRECIDHTTDMFINYALIDPRNLSSDSLDLLELIYHASPCR